MIEHLSLVLISLRRSRLYSLFFTHSNGAMLSPSPAARLSGNAAGVCNVDDSRAVTSINVGIAGHAHRSRQRRPGNRSIQLLVEIQIRPARDPRGTTRRACGIDRGAADADG